MYNNKEETICLIHQLQIEAINMDLNSDCQLRRYCSKCLIDKTYDGTLCINSEINEHIQEIKNNFLEKKAIYLKHNLSTIETIQNTVQNLKANFSSSFDKIYENLQAEKTRLKDQCEFLQKTLDLVNLDNFSQFKLSTNENVYQIESFKNLIKSSLDQIKNNENLQFCIQEIDKLEEEKEELIFTRQFNNEESNIIATPSLKIQCQEHKKQIIAFDMNINRAKENRMACIHCIEQNPNQYTSLKTVQDKWKKFEEFKKHQYQQILDQYKENKDHILEQLQIINEAHQEMNHQITLKLNDYYQNLTQQIEQIFNQMGKNWAICQQKEIYDNIENLIIPTCNQEFSCNLQEYYTNQENCVNLNIFDSIKKIKETLKESFYQICQLIKINSNLQIKQKEIQIYDKITFTRSPFQINSKQVDLSLSIQIPSKLEIKSNEIQISMLQKQKYFSFENLPSQKIAQDENCYALIFNPNNNLLVAGCGSKLQTFTFIDGSLKNQSIIDQHQNNVSALCFIKFNQFISGDSKGQIYFWIQQNNDWIKQQEILLEHTEQINQIIFSAKFNQIITCSNDKTIKIFSFTQNWVCQQTLDSHQNYVCSIALNLSETMLISSGSDKQLKVYKRKNKFTLMQNIQVEDIIYRLSFIEELKFCVQVSSGIHLSFYNFDEKQKQFILSQTTEVQNQKSCIQGFPIGFCNQSSMIICKHGTYINILNKMNNQIYRTEQSINFDTMYFYGAMSSDGNHIATWDYKTKQIQVRKLIQN
ncbi:unnamed protein product [Paramecium primaurelia]|uniref:WD domain, G-beta repeat protein n=1 Tax=Paramecium primaurelia TaxID=5886 RepID=A0A8S1NKZ2_PARPR|nr:unnamed protein product [Paramecium primaurelia]